MSDNLINVIRILNPFDNRERATEQLEWLPGKSMAEYFPFQEDSPIVLSVNGRIVPDCDRAVTFLSANDYVVICPVPQGGGQDSKQVMRMVAMIGLAIAAPGIGNFLAGSLGWGAFGASVLTAGVMIAGALLINSALPAQNQTSNNASSTTSYGVDGAKNTSQEGLPVPVCYGSFRTAGNLIATHIDNVSNTQNLYLLYNAG